MRARKLLQIPCLAEFLCE